MVEEGIYIFHCCDKWWMRVKFFAQLLAFFVLALYSLQVGLFIGWKKNCWHVIEDRRKSCKIIL